MTDESPLSDLDVQKLQPAFTIGFGFGRDAHRINIYASGKVEGFGDAEYWIVNKIPALLHLAATEKTQ